MYLTTLLPKVVSFNDFVADRDRDGNRDRTERDIWTDRIFSEDIIFNKECDRVVFDKLSNEVLYYS